MASPDSTIAVLGPGGVGGVLAGVLDRAATEVVVVARDDTAALIADRGLRVDSVWFGTFVARPRAVTRLEEPVGVLIVATKAIGLQEALERVAVEPRELVLPLLNGLDHLPLLRARFGTRAVAGSIRIEADRPEPGLAVHTSPFLRVDMASADPGRRPAMAALAATLREAGVPARVLGSEAQVMWAKLVRLNALACMTSAYDLPLGPIRSTPELRAELVSALEEGAAVARAEGADVYAADALSELDEAHATLGSSMWRDITAGRPCELDAIPGAVLRAAARRGLPCPTIARLVALIVRRTGVPAPAR
jgi:2-dehydropantoate 2-reductase